MILTTTWVRAVRAPFFTASIIPVLVGAVAAWHDGFVLSLWWGAITLIGVISAHAAANLINDYFDHKSGADWLNRHRSPFNGGSGVIQHGHLRPRQVVSGALMLLMLAALCGVILAAARGWPILLFAAAGGMSALAYTAGPRLAYRGLGELLIAINFGLLPVLGSYYVQAGTFGWTPVAASIPIALLIAGVLYVNQFPDIEADAAVAKRNLVVKLGTARASRGYVGLLAFTYVAVLAGVLTGLLPVTVMVVVLTLPLAIASATGVLRHHHDPRAIIPACALTVTWHLFTGLLLAGGLLLGRTT